MQNSPQFIYIFCSNYEGVPVLKSKHMKLIKSFINFLFKSRPSAFMEAVSEGFKDAFEEMGGHIQ
jgi:hypothetical protein